MCISERSGDLWLSISSDSALGERQIHAWFG